MNNCDIQNQKSVFYYTEKNLSLFETCWLLAAMEKGHLPLAKLEYLRFTSIKNYCYKLQLTTEVYLLMISLPLKSGGRTNDI